MFSDSLQGWANELKDQEAQVLLLQAAKEHPHGFTNSDDVGMGWFQTWRKQGYDMLPPYARNYLAGEYLRLKGDPHIRRITVK